MVEEVILKNIDKENSIFVFPTQVTALMWAEKTLFLSNFKAVALERFIAWDTFKSSAVRSVKQDKTSIPSAVRKLFSQKIIEKNINSVKNGSPLFTSLIPRAYARYGTSFADWIASLLPQLSSWREKAGSSIPDEEDKDLQVLMNEYTLFLQEHDLFEPAWEKPPFHDNGCRYYLFFPTVLQDYEEYKKILLESPNITIIDVPPKKICTDQLKVVTYTNAREEIRKTALFIRSLREEKNISYTSIALHVPGIEDLYPYITREFSLRGIPYQLRAGKTLSSYPSGTLFSLIKQCASDSFSFASLKQLLTNTSFPWRIDIKHSIDVFLQYGITNNCLVSYETDGHFIDIWEKTLAAVPNGFIASFYHTLKSCVMRFTTALSFSDLRQSYFAFKHAFFDSTAFSEEADLVLSRCITELMALSSLEEEYRACIPADPLSFFCRYLDSCEYLAQTQLRGVHIFPYKTAAASPFDYSILINSGQKQISVLYKPLEFLSRNKRDRLNIEDSNVSDQFAVLYSLSKTRFSCASKTFSGWALPHSVFESITDNFQYDDSFIKEKTIFESIQKPGIEHGVKYLHRVQKDSFLKWHNPLPPLKKPISLDPLSLSRVQEFLCDKKTGKLKIYATALREYFSCPLRFLYKNIFALKPVSLEANLLDDVFLGTIYHAVLNRFFSFYKNNSVKLPAGSLSLDLSAAEVLQKAVNDVINGFPESCFTFEFISDLTVQVVKAQEASFYKKLSAFLMVFLQFFGGSTILSTEEEYVIEKDDYMLKGYIDLVLENSDGIWILDFKTGAVPSKKECVSIDGSDLSDFQLALYTKLYEQAAHSEIFGAGFFSIHQKKLTTILGQIQNSLTKKISPLQKKERVTRDPDQNTESSINFEDTLDALEQDIQIFKSNIQNNIFSLPGGIPFDTCSACKHKAVCRTTFIVDGDKTAMKKAEDTNS